jgi:hypothetical protein
MLTKKQKKLGRPKLPKNRAKAVLFAARFTQQDAKPISLAIQRSGKSKSQWVRQSLIEAASELPPPIQAGGG